MKKAKKKLYVLLTISVLFYSLFSTYQLEPHADDIAVEARTYMNNIYYTSSGVQYRSYPSAYPKSFPQFRVYDSNISAEAEIYYALSTEIKQSADDIAAIPNGTGSNLYSGWIKYETMHDNDSGMTFTNTVYAPSTLSDSYYIIYAKVIDNGNIYYTSSYAFGIDKTAPVISAEGKQLSSSSENELISGSDGKAAITISDFSIYNISITRGSESIASESISFSQSVKSKIYYLAANEEPYTVKVSDKGGNTTTVSVRVTGNAPEFSDTIRDITISVWKPDAGRTIKIGQNDKGFSARYGYYTNNIIDSDSRNNPIARLDSDNNTVPKTNVSNSCSYKSSDLYEYIENELLYANDYAVGNQNTYLSRKTSDNGAIIVEEYKDAPKTAYSYGSDYSTLMNYGMSDNTSYIQKLWKNFSYDRSSYADTDDGTAAAKLLSGIKISAELYSSSSSFVDSASVSVTTDGRSISFTLKDSFKYTIADKIKVTVSRDNFTDTVFYINIQYIAPYLNGSIRIGNTGYGFSGGQKNGKTVLDAVDYTASSTERFFDTLPQIWLQAGYSSDDVEIMYTVQSDVKKNLSAVKAIPMSSDGSATSGWVSVSTSRYDESFVNSTAAYLPDQDGTYMVYAMMIDGDDIQYTSSAFIYTLDQSAPIIRNASTGEAYDASSVNTVYIKDGQTVSVTVDEANLKKTVVLKGTVQVTSSSENSFTYELSPCDEIYTITATDKAGKTASVMIKAEPEKESPEISTAIIGIYPDGCSYSGTYDNGTGTGTINTNDILNKGAYEVVYDGSEHYIDVRVKAIKTGDVVENYGEGISLTDKATIYFQGTNGDWSTSHPVYANSGTYKVRYRIVSSAAIYDDVDGEFTITIKKLSIGKCSINLPEYEFDYTGDIITPQVKVTDGESVLKEGTDYELSGETSTASPGEHTITVSGIGNYTDTKKISYSVTKGAKDISSLRATIPSAEYNGGTQTPSFTIEGETGVLTEGLDYTVEYSNNINAGDSARIDITGIGDYTGTKTIYFSIAKRGINNVLISSIPEQTYTGESISPEVTITDRIYKYTNGKNMQSTVTLVEGVDYTLSGELSVTKPGDYTITVTGTGNYTGSQKIKYSVKETIIDIGELTFEPIESVTYTGKAQTPAIKITDGKNYLTEGTDFETEYTNNIKAGTGKAIITGIGKYTGTKTITFTINKKPLSSVSAGVQELIYNGKTQTPAINVTDGTLLLTEDTDYTLTGDTSVKNAGEYTVKLTGKGNYTGNKSISYTVKGMGLTSSMMTVESISATYNGRAFRPKVTLTNAGTTLTESTDYSVSYSNNINAGTATIKVTGTGNYSGTLNKTFTISPKKLTDDMVSKLGFTGKTYLGGAIKPSLTVKDTDVSTASLIEGTDFTITYSDNTNVGVATITVTGKGNYSSASKVTRTFSIQARKLTNDCISTIAAQSYTGKAITPALSITCNGRTLVKGTDYTVAYKNNTAPGTASVTVTGKGNYTGTATAAFKINSSVKLSYRAYVQKKGWMAWKTSGMAGTTDNLRMETIQMKMSGVSASKGGIKYKAYVQKKNWTQWADTAKSTTYAGTKGQSLRVEAIQIKPWGTVATAYDVYYRAYSDSFGWLGWAKNGASAGTAGYAYKLRAFEVKLVAKGSAAPTGSGKKAYIKKQ